MKSEKLTDEEKLNIQLRNFTIEEIEAYIELLLTKCLEAIEKEDLSTYGSIEKTLNNSLIIFSSKVRNFNIIYNRIKLRVANKFLKKYLNNNNLSVLEDVSITGTFLTVEEAEKIAEAEEFKRFKKAKNRLTKADLTTNEVYSNDRYSYYVDLFTLTDKETGFYSEVDVDSNLELLKAFITKDSAILDSNEKAALTKEDVPIIEIVKEDIKLEAKAKLPSKYDLEDFVYYNENEVFLALVDNYDLIIYHKRTGTKVLIESFNKENWFLKEFASYCMGKEGIVIKDLNTD